MTELGYSEDQCMGDRSVRVGASDPHQTFVVCRTLSVQSVRCLIYITDKPCGSLLPMVGAVSLTSTWSSSPPSLFHIRDSVVQGTVGAVKSTYCGGLVVCCRR